jgi:hypothetical protein
LLRSRNSGVRAKVANAQNNPEGGKDMKPDKTTLLSRQMGTLPDWCWYQMNGQSPEENLQEQRAKMIAELTQTEDDSVHITSEVTVK